MRHRLFQIPCAPPSFSTSYFTYLIAAKTLSLSLWESSRMDFDPATMCQLLKQFAFLGGKPHRQDYLDSRKEIATAFSAQVWHTFTGQPEHTSILRLRWYSQHE